MARVGIVFAVLIPPPGLILKVTLMAGVTRVETPTLLKKKG